MSLYFADANDYLQDAASVGGWSAFSTWARRQDAKELRLFVRRGHTDRPDVLADEVSLLKAKDQGVEEVLRGLEKAARRADEILLVSDGVGGVDDEPPTAKEIVRELAAKVPGWKRVLSKAEQNEGKIYQHVRSAFKKGLEILKPVQDHLSAEVMLSEAVQAVEKALDRKSVV